MRKVCIIRRGMAKSMISGFSSLGNISGTRVSFHGYMRGNNLNDLRKDWEIVGADMRKSMRNLLIVK
ncbi:hypothetical protein E5358_13385 [Palleniella muris]|uniref:Uncharacterized protein n=1 Tax=Palleniella muris TaxID=3038145 RepID=A0AC61QM72_9BACT|nr:hypothetical protein [Palleniella muris]TGX80192.1 hypothetical protein E5358_13385 [Palleniella muris]